MNIQIRKDKSVKMDDIYEIELNKYLKIPGETRGNQESYINNNTLKNSYLTMEKLEYLINNFESDNKIKEEDICFVSSIISNENNLLIDNPKNFKKFGKFNFKMICDKDIKFDGWDTIMISKEKLRKYVNNNEIKKKEEIYMSRYAKFMIWKYFKEKNINYKFIVYCDGWLYPKSNFKWCKFAEIVNHQIGFSQSIHKCTIFEEINDLPALNKVSIDDMERLKKFLFSNNCKSNIIYAENTMLFYDPNNSKVTKTMEKFWQMYTQEKLTFRDQPLWNFICYKFKLKRIILEHRKVNIYFDRSGKGNHTYEGNHT
jgi:hypothetical protein